MLSWVISDKSPRAHSTHFEITRAQQTKNETKKERRATVIKNMTMQHRRIKSKAEN